MSITPVNFGLNSQKQLEGFIGNGITRTFVFVSIPTISKSDIQISIYNTQTAVITTLSPSDYTYTRDISGIGFTISLGVSIVTPSANQQIIAELVRPVKNDIVLPDGSEPTPAEITIGLQGLAISLGVVSQQAKNIPAFTSNDQLNSIGILPLPSIPVGTSKFVVGYVFNNTTNKFEQTFISSLDSDGNDDRIEVSSSYVLTAIDKHVIYKPNGIAGQKLVLFKHTDILSISPRYITVENYSNFNLDIEYLGNIIGNVKPSELSMWKENDSLIYTEI